MSVNTQVQENVQEPQKVDNKEQNFRMLEAKYQRQLEEERTARIEAERIAREALSKKQAVEEDDDDDEPYIDRKKLQKQLAKFGEHTQRQTQTDIEKAVEAAIQKERKQNWLKSNPDFYDTLQKADKLAEADPELAESILEMPDTFERQKLVYKNIKALGLHQDRPKNSIQDKIDNNKKNVFYQPSMPTPVALDLTGGDFSQAGQKAAYDRIQAMKARITG